MSDIVMQQLMLVFIIGIFGLVLIALVGMP